MSWPEELYSQNKVEVREHCSSIARVLVDEAEAFIAHHPDDALDVREVTEERLQMMMDALDERITQQLIIRGHILEGD